MQRLLISTLVLSLIVACSARPHFDYDYVVESTEDPGVAIDRETRHKHSHHHKKHNNHEGSDYLKTNRLGKLRKYFEDHYL